MTLRLVPDHAGQAHRAAFWQVARGRLTGDSMACAAGTGAVMGLGLGPLERTLVTTVDVVVDELVQWADEANKNPACMATSVTNKLFARLPDPQALLLATATELLRAADPSVEADTPHEHCHPWPEQTQVPSLAAAHDGRVAAEALEIAGLIPAMKTAGGLVLCMEVPDLLTKLLWGRSGSDKQRMGVLLDAKFGS